MDQLKKDLTGLFLAPEGFLDSTINFVTFFLIGWAFNPEAIYYNWLIWAFAAALWTSLILVRTRGRIILDFLKQGTWLLLIWPVYTLALWLSGYGLMHRKFIAVAFMLAVPWYYLKQGQKDQIARLARLGLWYLGFIALTSIAQMVTYPEIARDLATGRGTGNFRASALLANFHTVYESVIVVVVFAGVWLRTRGKQFPLFWLAAGSLLLTMVIFSRYDIALIALLLGLALILAEQPISKWWNRRSLSSGFPPAAQSSQTKREWKEVLLTSGIYLVPAATLLTMRAALETLILKLDFRTIQISEKLFNRIWVYFRSIVLFLQYPLLGYGVEPNPTQHMTGQHSDYLELLGEYGILGFLVFLMPWCYLLLKMRGQISEDRRHAYWIGVIIFHFIFILNPVLEVSSTTLLFLLLPGLLFDDSFGTSSHSLEHNEVTTHGPTI